MATHRAATRHDWQARILRVLVFLQQHLDEDVGIERLAAVAHASPYHFHRMFRGLVGEPVAAHLRRLRLERAAMHLKTGERSVLELALEAGYESHEAFTRAFRRAFGQSPSTFREERAFARLASPNGIHFRSLDEGGPNPEPIRMGDLIDMTERTIEIRELPTFRAAFLRHTGPYEEFAQTYGELFALAFTRGEHQPGTSGCLEFYLNDPSSTPPAELRTELWVPLA